MNELLLVIEVVLTFGAVVLAKKLFGKAGLMAWTAVAMILANLTVVKCVPMFGLDVTLGNVMFASTFLATDMIVELYGDKEAKLSILMGVCATVCFMVCTQVTLLYVPTAFDIAQEPMATLFALNLRSSIASIACCMLANLADVWVYKKIREATKGKYMGFRSSFAAILCNCVENFLFMFLAFGGLYEPVELVVMAITTSAIEGILGLCNPPFLYLATWREKHGERTEPDTELRANGERA